MTALASRAMEMAGVPRRLRARLLRYEICPRCRSVGSIHPDRDDTPDWGVLEASTVRRSTCSACGAAIEEDLSGLPLGGNARR